ncbi:MAG: TM2 domain-containing protein [Synergistaceae bacterium]
MDQTKADYYIITNAKFFPQEKMPLIRERLANMPEDKLMMVSTLEMKDPTTILLISIFLGSFGVDRFMIGDTGIGILKLLTCGLCGILTIIDWFTISAKTREMNFNKFMTTA